MGFGKDGKGVIHTTNQSQALSTLAASTALKIGTAIPITQDFRLISADGVIVLDNSTTDDYVLYGIADNELSTSEIEQALTVEGPIDRNDRVSEERSQRPVFVIGVLGQNGNAAGITAEKFKKTIRWTFSDTEGYCFFVFNVKTNAALSTGAEIHLQSKQFGVWV